MSTFSKTPHLLTKEKLKNALRANNIPLPRAEQKKAFYVDLYLEHLTSQNEVEEEEFSSSDDEESSEYSPMRASKVLELCINVFCCIFNILRWLGACLLDRSGISLCGFRAVNLCIFKLSVICCFKPNNRFHSECGFVFLCL